jgi:hypothetical protein
MAHIFYVNTGGFSMSSTQPVNSLDIYYQNFKGLRTKQLEFYNNVRSTDHIIICKRIHGLTACVTITIYLLTVTQFSILTGYVPIRREAVEY